MFVEGARVERVAVARPVSVMLGSASSGELVQLAPGGGPRRRRRSLWRWWVRRRWPARPRRCMPLISWW
ncbi:hypothetical protein BZL29_2204 [Mycobacterium kansasii]|uniref:Uncharacterized protein n=1 Tax=Mycobacterium kansasii TaxID=1768 RepID=A0A1V3XNX8_MYCKA|nr:hypothetical protein BZL29_2204 [Mycobacterium kansasii]